MPHTGFGPWLASAHRESIKRLRYHTTNRGDDNPRISVCLMPVNLIARRSPLGLRSDFVRKGLLLRSGYVRDLAAASYPHIQGGGGNFPTLAGRGCGEWRLTDSKTRRKIAAAVFERDGSDDKSKGPKSSFAPEPCPVIGDERNTGARGLKVRG